MQAVSLLSSQDHLSFLAQISGMARVRILCNVGRKNLWAWNQRRSQEHNAKLFKMRRICVVIQKKIMILWSHAR